MKSPITEPAQMLDAALPSTSPDADRVAGTAPAPAATDAPPREIGGRPGPDPTRYGDWERAGRCIDF